MQFIHLSFGKLFEQMSEDECKSQLVTRDYRSNHFTTDKKKTDFTYKFIFIFFPLYYC